MRWSDLLVNVAFFFAGIGVRTAWERLRLWRKENDGRAD